AGPEGEGQGSRSDGEGHPPDPGRGGDWGSGDDIRVARGAGQDADGPIGVSSSVETMAGTAFGTPAYMSPEQAEGRLGQRGPPSDVYSLGAVLYTLLSGRAPFEYVWCDVTALLDRVRQGEFPPPRRVNPRVPRALEAVCLKAMSTRVEDRYAS